VRQSGISPFILPAPADVGSEWVRLMGNPRGWNHTYWTLYATLAGFFWAILIGVSLGVLIARIRWWEEYTARLGGEMDNNPSPGNKAGGLTTILEKSLGAVAKGGTTRLKAVYRYAEAVTESGLVFMDTPGYDPVSITGMVAGGAHPSPIPHAHVVTTTTHKTLRGPRGGLILARPHDELHKKFNSLIFPGTQGGPLMHVIAAKAVAFLEALQPEFKDYQRQVVANARAMAGALMARGVKIVSGGTDNHLFLVDLVERSYTGKDADAALGRAHITVNKNTVPNDPRSPFVTSGLRIGTPAVTTRGFREAEVTELASWIADVLEDVNDEAVIERTRRSVIEICRRFPVYG
jgi:hypothetical protein